MRGKNIGLFLVLFPLAALATEVTTLPFPEDLLRGEERQSVKEVVEESTAHQQMNDLRLPGRQDVITYLLMHPDFTASLGRAAGVSQYTVERRGEVEYWANDHEGLEGLIEVLHAQNGQLVLYAEGKYQSGIIRIPGRLALVVHASERKDQESFYVENSVSSYVRVDSPLFHGLRFLFRPLVAHAAEKRIHRFFDTITRLLTELHQDPEPLFQALPPDTWQQEVEELRRLLTPSSTSSAGARTLNIPYE